MKSFRELDAWQVAMDLALTVYNLAEKLPANERFEMASQMRRAALSVPSNIAEGLKWEKVAKGATVGTAVLLVVICLLQL